MMKSLVSKVTLAASLAVALAACSDSTTDPITPANKPAAVTAVMATSGAQTGSVRIKWTGDSAKAATGLTGYRITVKDGSTTVKTENAAKTDSIYTVTGLTDGKMYSFEVVTVAGTEVSTAKSVSWAPAKRYSGTFKIYSSKSSNFGSGLALNTGEVLKVADGDKWDICLDDKDGRPLIGSPGASGYVDDNFMFLGAPTKEAKSVAIGREYLRVATLDDVFDVSSLDQTLDTTQAFSEKLKNLADAPAGGYAFVVRSRVNAQTVNFAKVLVRQVGGSYVQNASSNDAFVEVEVSYQTVTNLPYALVKQLTDVRSARSANSSK